MVKVSKALFSLSIFALKNMFYYAASAPPVIDLSYLDILSITTWNEGASTLYREIINALENHGVFVGINHPVPVSLLKASLLSSSSLFNLDETTKKSLKFNVSHHFGRGYLSFGSESGLESIFEPKEGYSYGHPDNRESNFDQWLQNPNRWPPQWSNSQVLPFNEIYRQFSSVSELIMMLLIQGRQRQGKHTQIMVAGGSEISIMRLFHYFPATVTNVQGTTLNDDQSSNSKKEVLGSSPHTDWGLLTIILQTGQGLQYRKDGAWVDVPYIENSLIFNAGDYFSLVTGHDIHSPVHRVLCPEVEERTSFVFFFYPHFSSPVTRMNKNQQNNNKIGKDDKLEYNTLTVLDYEAIKVTEIDKAQTISFGDYIMAKWRGVYRN